MITKLANAVVKSLDTPDEVRQFGSGKLDLVHLDETVCGRVVLQPGWRWSQDVKPIVKTDSCQAAHTQYVIQGRLTIVMDDGSQFEIKAGDACIIPPGHDAWVVGDEAFIAVDFTGMKEYAQQPAGWRFWRR